jgi:hypothetical protein
MDSNLQYAGAVNLIVTRLSRPSRVTTLPAPMSASSPIETPGRMIAPAPIQTLRPIRTGRPNSRSEAASRRDRLRQPGTRAV